MEIKPIAYIKTGFNEKFGLPRNSGRVEISGTIVFEPEFRNSEALNGIEEYNYLWLIFDFNMSHRSGFAPTVRPPRLGGNIRKGVFATRSPFRPNNLGLSCVKFISTEKTPDKGVVINVSGVDLLNNTPIYDIKPYIPFSDCKPDAKGGFSDKYKDHKLEVILSDNIKLHINKPDLKVIIDCIADDPRPAYIDNERTYGMQYNGYEIKFSIKENLATILSIEEVLSK